MLGRVGSWMSDSLTPMAVQEADLANLLAPDSALAGGDETSVIASVIRMVAALALVLGLLILSLWALRRLSGRTLPGAKGGGEGIEVLHQRPLGGQRHLTVVRWEGRKILLGVTGDTITSLASEPDDVTPADEESFRSELQQVYKRPVR